MSVEIEVVEDPARACAAMLVGACAGGGHIVLAGGSTPKPAYEKLVEAVAAVGVGLAETTLWFGDERCVTADDERSNYRMVKQSLLDPLGRGQPADRQADGGRARTARGGRGVRARARGGRTAAVRPGAPGDRARRSHRVAVPGPGQRAGARRLVVGVPEAGLEPFVPRISLTLPALAHADRVVFLVSGAAKADAVAGAFGRDAKPDPHVPSSLSSRSSPRR